MRYTADTVVITAGTTGQVLLIQRDWPPYQGCWALPGGHQDPGETSLQAAIRELREETGVHLHTSALHEIGTWAAPGRDPRGPYSTTAYVATVPATTRIVAGTDARAVRWWPLHDLPDLAFDHADILAAAITLLPPA
ncbi:NUDIX domain-containing protein [Streptomyces buecherae]|uniref:NUDIX hydrolase n=1 Tax=Streptomyces buecherae TaxID=2763006 RepID=A0A7H8NKC9_9ACTN|nr:NUDIX hydrolase [Streptomyces buecherae]QKW55047.1 NUDIX hydrolase [Streptomyces buecherae]